jgi:nitrous oxide reductase accessory protein NosL
MQCFKILTVCLFSLLFLLHCAPRVVVKEAREECRLCGMWIDQYIHTRHVLTTEDGAKVSFCSFTCAAKYLKRHEAEAQQLQVADYLSAELADAGEVFYLLGSDAPPVMSNTSIIAFASSEEAASFQKLHGGKIMTFDEVLAQHPQ